jgi:hypothetical protein
MTASRAKRAISVCVIGALALAPAAPTAAQIYKWVDGAGTVHFSDAPPARTGSTAGAIEVLPRSEHRPAAASTASSSPDQPPRESAADPYDDERPDDEAWSDQAAEEEEEEVVVEVFDDGAVDPAVRYRANSPRNRPGQPIRPPGAQAPRRR